MSTVEVHDEDGPGLVRMVSSLRRLKAGEWKQVVADCNIPNPSPEELPEDGDIYDQIAAYIVEKVVSRWARVATKNATSKVAAALRGLSEASKAALLAWVKGGA